MKMPKGFPDTGGRIKIAVYLEPELFHKICARALKENKPFSRMVNELCDIGIFDLEEEEAA
jgi:hypothetical protein